jgi:hypothetical protein
VVVNTRRSQGALDAVARASEATGARAAAIIADVTDAAAVDAMIAETAAWSR